MGEAQLNSEESWCTTEIRTFKISFTWTIKNFSFVAEYGDKVRSPYFSPNHASTSDIEWCLAVAKIPMDEYDECADTPQCDDDYYLVMSLCSRSPTKKVVFAKYTFFILDNENKKLTFVKKRAVPIRFFESVHELDHPTVTFSSLFDNTKKNLLPDDTLKILCEITYRETEIDYVSGPVLSGKLSSHQLSRDFEELLKNQLMSDVKLVTNGETFNAHKVILSARSPVFAAMFSHEELLEGKNGEVKIQDVDEDILREILHFIYTGKTENLKNMARDVLPVADKYDLRELKEECEFHLANTLSIENAAELLTFANFHNATLLKENFLNFFKRNSDAVMETTGWNTLVRNNSDLLNDVKAELPQLTVK